MDNNSRMFDNKSTKEQNSVQTSAILKRKNLIIEPVRNLSINVKLAIAQFNFKDRVIAEQVAYLLDDVVTAVEKGKSSITKTQVLNQVSVNSLGSQNEGGRIHKGRERKGKEGAKKKIKN